MFPVTSLLEVWRLEGKAWDLQNLCRSDFPSAFSSLPALSKSPELGISLLKGEAVLGSDVKSRGYGQTDSIPFGLGLAQTSASLVAMLLLPLRKLQIRKCLIT